MMNIEKTRSLERSDMGHGERRMHPGYLYDKFEKYSAQDHKKTKWSYLLCFAKSSGIARFFLGFVLFLSSELIAFIPTQILNVLVSDLENENLGKEMTFVYNIRTLSKMDLHSDVADFAFYFSIFNILGSFKFG